MVIFVALLLTVLCFIAVASPLLRKKDNSTRAWSYEFEELPAGSGSSRIMVKQLETDYRTGILSEDEFHSLQDSFQGTSAGETRTGAPGLDEEIENRIAGLRRGGKAAAGDEIEEKVRQLRRISNTTGREPAAGGGTQQGNVRFCRQCGTKAQKGDRFCARCGEQLT